MDSSFNQVALGRTYLRSFVAAWSFYIPPPHMQGYFCKERLEIGPQTETPRVRTRFDAYRTDGRCGTLL
jgi:hypothetical protein